MQMIDEDPREVESSFRSQTSMMPEMYLEKGGMKEAGDNVSDVSVIQPSDARSNSVWTNNTNMEKGVDQSELFNS